jgi:PmbA protein
MDDVLSISEEALKIAKQKGADEVDVLALESLDNSYSQRLGKVESVETAISRDIGIRVFLKSDGKFRSSVISTNVINSKNLEETVDRAIFNAKISPIDDYSRLALREELYDNSQLSLDLESLNLCDKKEVTAKKLEELASQCEDAALSVKGINNSDGSEASFSRNNFALLTSNGFSGSYRTSSVGFSVSVIAEKDGLMETDYDYCYKRHLEDLESPEKIGLNAGELAAKKLSSKRIKSTKAPIIYDKRVSKSLLGNFLSAINGASVSKQATFLSDKMGEQIFPSNINIIDDPRISKGLASQPFDCEGLECRKLNLVESGNLTSWILDIRNANKMNLISNARASRSISSNPHPSSTNCYIEAGEISFDDMIKETKNGLYLTNTFGMGINIVTGDYSQGASGFWIENGEIAYPVNEITIAGNLKDMFRNIQIANDLEFRYSINAPTIKVEQMTIAGN